MYKAGERRQQRRGNELMKGERSSARERWGQTLIELGALALAYQDNATKL